MLSTTLIDAGQIRDLATCSINLTPCWKSGKTIDSYSLVSGIGLILTIASVMMPRLPSLPNISYVISGPEETLGQLFNFVIVPYIIVVRIFN